ncbi:TPA: hypothetical protein NI766_005792 [Pseudomonas aeruginosa]|nr:hypothetical protein [Pseudomonas aeruginosa]HCF9605240.1 hypothetical protein [Pseudomonas aeruginosa]HCF9611361.1 hypothetical protein [Pseudomonas aeruginosa]HCF9618473.1 hypothetical protein [Pseudomonas aeruginosa]HCF9643060.1 hypothetical protein [Pseudomonas aeruginosa]
MSEVKPYVPEFCESSGDKWSEMQEDAAAKGDAARQQCGGMEMEIEELRAEAQALREEVAKLTQYNKSLDEENTRLLADCEKTDREVAALRARVVVVPEPLNEGDARRECGEYGAAMQRGYNACLRELARLNGMTVSEGLVQGMAKFAREIICGALDGGSFDGADIQESAERHGLIAKQVMNEPCRGPEEYCACAWSTSFPAECYRVTPKLRALLNEDKENSNG